MRGALIQSAIGLLGYPLRPVPVLAIVVFALGFALAAMAGLFGLPLLCVLVIWYAKYVFIVLESSALGARDPPVLSIEMVNPVSEPAPLLLVAVLMIVAGVGQFVGGALGSDARSMFLWFAVLLLPASIALLAVEQQLLPAINPARMLRLAFALRWRYALLWLIVAGCVAMIALAPLWIESGMLLLAFGLYLLLLCAHAFGRVLYSGRDAIGLDVDVDPDRALDRTERERAQLIERMLDGVYRQARQGKLRAAYAALLTGIDEEAVDTSERLAVHQRLMTWEETSLALAHARDGLGGIVGAGELRAGWRMCADCLRIDARFRPADADAAFALARFALEGGDQDLALLLLEDFDLTYDGRGPTQAAALLAVRLLLEHRDDTAAAGRLIGRMRERFGAEGLRPELAAYAAALAPPPAPSLEGRG